jgi:ABC-type branched-subunit amino acid transport system substrate-binding protein/DNA-binding CsgD family transcriptional regulator
MNEVEFNNCLKKLTKQQDNILKLVLEGKSNQEIAGFLEESTVRRHIFNIYTIFGLNKDKSGISHRDELIKLFVQYKGARVDNCVRNQEGYSKWEDPDSNRNIERAGSNFYLERAKNEHDPKKALKLYEHAVNGDRSDPYIQIYLNNAKARQVGDPFRIGVVIAKAGNDFHEFASTQVLRGVADAQNEFNQKGGKNGRLLEIDIRNDGNRRSDAEEIAKKFAKDMAMLAIVGHHSSESTKVALSIYEQHSIAVISPTSTSSTLSGSNFFRTVGSTKAVASKYTQYIMGYLNLDKVAIIYHRGNEFSETLKKDFENTFRQTVGSREQRGQITESFDIIDISLNIEESIKKIKQASNAVVVISSIETNSVAIAIANQNAQQPKSQQLKLLFTTSLPETPALEKGGTSLEGSVLVSPSLKTESKYMRYAKDRWQQPDLNWRVATAYDATQAIIEAIKLSTVVNRAAILENLEQIDLPIERTSGFGLSWSKTDYHANAKVKYGIWQIHHGRFEEI